MSDKASLEIKCAANIEAIKTIENLTIGKAINLVKNKLPCCYGDDSYAQGWESVCIVIVKELEQLL